MRWRQTLYVLWTCMTSRWRHALSQLHTDRPSLDVHDVNMCVFVCRSLLMYFCVIKLYKFCVVTELRSYIRPTICECGQNVHITFIVVTLWRSARSIVVLGHGFPHICCYNPVIGQRLLRVLCHGPWYHLNAWSMIPQCWWLSDPTTATSAPFAVLNA